MWTHLPPPPPHRPLPQHVGNVPDQQFAIFYPEMFRFLSLVYRVTYLLDKNVEFGTRASTVKTARVDNDAPVSDQGCHIKLTGRGWSKRLCTLLGQSGVDIYFF